MTDGPSRRAVSVAFFGQVPPPMHGQAAVNEMLLEGDYDDVELHHVHLDFSDSLTSVGRFELAKLGRLAKVARSARRAVRDAEVVYYSLGSRTWTGVARDAVLLGTLARRPTLFHLHLHGLPDQVARLPQPLRALARRVYGRGHLAVLSELLSSPELASMFRSVIELPNGVDASPVPRTPTGRHDVLFIGNLQESKGVDHVLQAVAALTTEFADVHLTVGGAPVDRTVEQWQARAGELGIGDRVVFLGQVTPETRDELMARADVFCFAPHQGEAQPLVILEAMAAGVPIVSTRWRAIPAMVDHGETGRLADPGDVDSIASCLAATLSDPAGAAAMAGRARERYETDFTCEAARRRFETAIVDLAEREASASPGRWWQRGRSR